MRSQDKVVIIQTAYMMLTTWLVFPIMSCSCELEITGTLSSEPCKMGSMAAAQLQRLNWLPACIGRMSSMFKGAYISLQLHALQ